MRGGTLVSRIVVMVSGCRAVSCSKYLVNLVATWHLPHHHHTPCLQALPVRFVVQLTRSHDDTRTQTVGAAHTFPPSLVFLVKLEVQNYDISERILFLYSVYTSDGEGEGQV